MSVSKAQIHKEVTEGFKNKGPLAPPNIISLTDPRGGGVVSIAGHQHDITSIVSAKGGSLTMVASASGSIGDGKKPVTGERGSKNVASKTGDKSKRTLTRLANPDGTGCHIDSGAGGGEIIHFGTADGNVSFTMSSKNGGSIVLRVGGTELVVNGKRQQVESTKIIVQEQLNHKSELEKYKKDMEESFLNALKPYTAECPNCSGSGQQSGST